MAKANVDIRTAAEQAGIKLWQIADRYGVYDGNFSRLLRKELPTEKKEGRIQAVHVTQRGCRVHRIQLLFCSQRNT